MKRGYLLLLIIVLLIICMVILGVIINLKQSDETPSINVSNVDNSVNLVMNRNDFYTIENSAIKFYKYYSLMSENIDEDNLEKVYNLLDEKYIDYKGITKTNIRDVLPKIKSSVVNITNMYMSVQNEDILVYIVEGTLREEISKELLDFKIMLQIDLTNKTFSVMLQDYIQDKYEKIELGSNLKLERLNNIKINRYNQYVVENISDETYVTKLLNRYKEEALYNIERAYNNLDKEYSEEKFKTFGKFQEYVEKNKEEISNIKIEKYQISDKDEYTQYMCVDQRGRYYIFRETGIMKYTLMIDNYTIDLPEFLEKYNVANTMKKVGYNIQRCLDAINNCDYSYIYNKLDFEFKALNYPTLESFENVIITKLFDYNEIKTVSSINEGNIYIFKLTITDVKDNTKEQNMTFIMKLKEGTDFVMSLSFE